MLDALPTSAQLGEVSARKRAAGPAARGNNRQTGDSRLGGRPTWRQTLGGEEGAEKTRQSTVALRSWIDRASRAKRCRLWKEREKSGETGVTDRMEVTG